MSELPQLVVAVDIGTTSTKVLLISANGQVITSRNNEYPLYTPTPEIAEQDPDEIFQAVIQGIGQCTDYLRHEGGSIDQIVCVSFSAAMHSLIAVDEDHQPLTNIITWADQRSQTSADQLHRDGTGLPIYRKTGTPIHPMSPFVKLVWMKANNPAIYSATSKWIGIKEYIFHKLFKRYIVDYSIASATGLFHLENLAWDEEALQIAGIRQDQLSEPVPSTYQVTGLVEQYAAAMGLKPDTPFVLGASDGVLANLGTGVMNGDRYAVTVGTSSAVRTVMERPTFDDQGRLFCYALTDDYWVIGGASNNGAIVLRWVMQELYAEEVERWKAEDKDPYAELMKEAESVPAGANGLLFLPLLSGERAPFWDANAKGVFFGLSLAHQKKHMLRAAMEGVMFQIASIAAIMQERSGAPQEIRGSGGFARSVLWSQMLADMLGITVVIPQEVDSSSMGAAQLGLYAMGLSLTLQQDWMGDMSNRFEPDATAYVRYRQLLPIYLRIYDQLKDTFEQLAVLQGN